MDLKKGDRVKIIGGPFRGEIHRVYFANAEKIITYENPMYKYTPREVMPIEESEPPPLKKSK